MIALDSLRYGRERNLAGLALLDRYLERVDHLFRLAAEKHSQSKHDPHAAVHGGVKKTVFSSSLYKFAETGNEPVIVINFERIRAGQPSVIFGDGPARRCDPFTSRRTGPPEARGSRTSLRSARRWIGRLA